MNDFIPEYLSAIDAAFTNINYLTSPKLKDTSKNELAALLIRVKARKSQFQKLGDEKRSNEAFHMQCMISSMIALFDMWAYIDIADYKEAWRCLIDAQEYLEVALRIQNYEGGRNLQQKIISIEKAIFRDIVIFFSMGSTKTIGKCSICNKNFDCCVEHIEGFVYMGTLCHIIEQKFVDINHVALVKSPKDRRCIPLFLNKGGKQINLFTGDSQDTKTSDSSEEWELENCGLYSFKKLDFD